MSNILNTTICDTRDAKARRKLRDVINSGCLWAPYSHDFLSDPSTTAPHAHPEPVSGSRNKRSRLIAGNDVASNNIQIRVFVLDIANHFNLIYAVALATIQDHNIQPCIYQLLQSLFVVWPRANSGCADELLGMWKF